MNAFIFISLYLSLSVFGLALLVLIIWSYKRNTTIPLLGDITRRKYLSARFHLWDALEGLEKRQDHKILRKLLFIYRKIGADFYYFLALLFRSTHDSYILLNCDVLKKECLELEYGAHLEAEKRATILSTVGLSSFIVLNFFIILTITLLPNLFFETKNIKAAIGDLVIIDTVEIASTTPNGPVFHSGYYSSSVTGIGDLNGDGVDDIAVGDYADYPSGSARGAFYIHFMNANGSIDSTVKINGSTLNGPTLTDSDQYGSSIANIGDLNGDGVNDIAVGAVNDDDIGSGQGSVYIHFMNTDGSIDSTVKIDGSTLNGPTLTDNDRYGSSVANIGDLNLDGVQDIAVGSYGDGAGYTGAIYIHFMNTDGSIDSTAKINDTTPNGPGIGIFDWYGNSITNIGDLDGDGVQDLAVGAYGESGAGTNRGTLYIHFMNTDGSIDSTVQINEATPNGPTLSDNNYYGSSVAKLGDLNSDGVDEIAVGAYGDVGSGTYQGALYVHYMNTDGSVDSTVKIDGSTPNGPVLFDNGLYGWSAANIGDLDNNGIEDIAVGAIDSTPTPILRIHFLQLSGTTVSGRLYSDEGITPITTANKDIVVLVNGVRVGTSTTDISGDYSLDTGIVLSPHDIITAFINTPTDISGSNKGVTVTVASSSGDVTNLDIYQDYLIVANENAASSTTNTDLFNGTNREDGITYIYDFSGGVFGTLNARSIYIRDSYSPDSDIILGAMVTATWTNSGTFIPGTNLVEFSAGSNTVIKGSNTFYDFKKADSQFSIIFKDSLTQTFQNNLILTGQGITSSPLNVRSSVPGVPFYLNILTASTTFNLLDIKDSYLFTGTTTEMDPTNSTNSGNTFGWFTPVAIGDGSIKSTVRIYGSGYDPTSIANIGDLNGDGVQDIAVGAMMEDGIGALYINFMNTDGSIDSTVEINSATPNGPALHGSDRYGSSVANIGDLDGDGVQDIAVGAIWDDDAGSYQGSLFIHFMNTDGSISTTAEIDSTTLNGPVLNDEDHYGSSVANIGDLDGDGVQDIAVGAMHEEGSSVPGSLFIHFMNTDGSISTTTKIDSATLNGPGPRPLRLFCRQYRRP